MVISDKSEMLNKYIDLSTPGLLDGKQSLHNFTLSCKTEFLRLISSKIRPNLRPRNLRAEYAYQRKLDLNWKINL